MGVEHVESVADLACRTALAFRGVANITIPTDVTARPAISSIILRGILRDRLQSRTPPMFGGQPRFSLLQRKWPYWRLRRDGCWRSARKGGGHSRSSDR